VPSSQHAPSPTGRPPVGATSRALTTKFLGVTASSASSSTQWKRQRPLRASPSHPSRLAYWPRRSRLAHQGARPVAA
jgi:hypothetical protein